MASIRSILGMGRKALAARLDHLHNTLENLGEKLREAVAQALGQTVGLTVRETLLGALNDRPTSFRDNHSSWQQTQQDWRREEYGWENDRYYEEDRRYHEDWEEEPPVQKAKQPTRIPLALSTGLRAVAWCLRRWWGKLPLVGAVAVGVVAACTTYLAGPIADAGLSLFESADQITSLRRAVQSGHDRMAW